MRKLVLLLLPLLLLGGVPFKVQHLLQRAIDNERDAAARYTAYAAKAMEEGYPGAASLFRAAAQAEMVHADRIATVMRERGIPVPAPTEIEPKAGTTAENLRDAATAETRERDGFYREAVDTAREAGDDAIALLFDQTRDTEVEHANLLMDASRHLEQLRTAKTFYVCGKCGYTTDIELPMCALCRLNKHPHSVE